MNNRRNYYRILHIQPDAPEEVIKASYRTIMQKLKMHPDLGGSHWNAVLVNEAYAVLSNPVKRSNYDKKLLEDFSKYSFQRKGISGEKKALSSIKNSQFKQELISYYCLFCKTPYQSDREYVYSSDCFECGSPLLFNKHGDEIDEHRRSIDRRIIEGRVDYYTYWPENPSSGRIHDVSPKGFCFITASEISAGAIIKVDGDHFRTVAEVTHCDSIHQQNQLVFAIGAAFLSVIFKHPKGGFLSVDV